MTRRPDSLQDCLDAAQADAERFHGNGPAQAWQPRRDWTPWALGAVTLAGVIGVAAWLLAPNASPERPRVVTLSSAATPAPRLAPVPARVDEIAAPAAAAPAPAPTRAACDGAGCDADALPQPGPLPSAMQAMAQDPDAWALTPEPLLATPAAAAEPPRTGLVNEPPIPDENDATPGDGDAVEALVEDVSTP